MLNEKYVKGEPLSGKEVAKLRSKEHVFVRGRHSVVVDVNVRGSNVELVYVKGRKAFGKEQYLDLRLGDRTTEVSQAYPIQPGEHPTFPPYAGESIAETLIDIKVNGLTERSRRDIEMKLATTFSPTELRRLTAMLLALTGE